MRAKIAVVVALGGLAVACAGGRCPRAEVARGNAGGEAVAQAPATPAQAVQQGPTVHETPEHDLAFEDHVVRASPSDAPPERLSPEAIEHVVQGEISDVHQCYENALVAHPELTGRVVVRFHVHSTGNVLAAEIAESTLGEAGQGVAECIVEHVDDWHFPQAAHDVAVTFPFVLEPAPAG